MRILEPDPQHSKTILVELDVAPCSAPRQSRRDTYDPCPAVVRYRAFQNQVALEWNLVHQEFPAAGARVTFWIPMPQSWSRKKKAHMQYQPHTSKPDIDNLCKALLDSLFRKREDSHIYDLYIAKFWHPGSGCIRVEIPI
jgi:Holliday junction resolvase RusA-like endonuclease